MSSPHRGAPRHTGLMLAGLLAIPVASVTLAARLGDVASSTDSGDAITGGLALFGGVVVGLLVQRLVAAVNASVLGVVRIVTATLRPVPGIVADTVRFVVRVVDATVTPTFTVVPSATGRRGPPIDVC